MDQSSTAPSLPSAPPLYKDRRGWLIAFGVVEILIACFFLLMTIMTALVIPSMPQRPGQPSVPSGMFYGIACFYLMIAAFFIAAGIGSIRRKNWARIAMIVASSIWLAFGVLGTVMTIVIMPMVMKQQQAVLQQNQTAQLPPNFLNIVMVTTAIFQVLMMVLLPLVFLLFYCGKNVKATCRASAGQASSGRTFPIPIIILVVWFGFSALCLVVAAVWLPLAVVFGLLIHGIAGRVIFLAYAAAYGYCAWSFYKLRVEGWWLAVFLWVLGQVSWVVTILRADLTTIYNEVYKVMGIDPRQMSIYSLNPDSMKGYWIVGLVVSFAMMALMLYSKRYFQRPQATAA
jgi:hypothetical protein